MNRFGLFQSVVAGLLLTVAPLASAANAQSAAAATCPGGGPRELTKDENSRVNDYEILLAKANSAHTTPPDLSPDVAALIACTAGGAVTPTQSTGTPANATSSASVAVCPGGGPRELTKDENSRVNDYEILLAKANSAHTTPPDLSPDIAALISCTAGAPVSLTPSSPMASTSTASTSSSATSSASTSARGPVCPAAGRES